MKFNNGWIYAVFYILAIVCANLTAAMLVPLPVIGLVAAGTFFFGPIFTLRDIIHQRLGIRNVYYIIAAAVVINACIGFIGAVDFRIIFASVLAMALSELADTQIFHKYAKEYWILKVLKSNVVSIPLDTVLFTVVAFYGIWPTDVMVTVIANDILIKFAMASIIILLNVKRLKEINAHD